MISIKDFLVRQLQKTSIFEMAYTRNKYMENLNNIRLQLIENWCLIRYCTLSGRTQTKNHWQNELYNYVKSLQDMTLKTKGKKYASEEVLIEWAELDNEDHIYKIFKRKARKENLDLNDPNIKQACKDFAKFGIHELIDIISMNDTDENFDYIDEYIYKKI